MVLIRSWLGSVFKSVLSMFLGGGILVCFLILMSYFGGDSADRDEIQITAAHVASYVHFIAYARASEAGQPERQIRLLDQ